MLHSFCHDSVTVVRPGSKQARGTTVADWSVAQSHAIAGCSVQTPNTSMDLDGRRQTSLAGTLYAPPSVDVRAGDRIDWTDASGNAHRFLVDGEPMPWVSPTGRVSHVQADLVEWRG